MAATKVYGYLLTLKIGTKIIKGLETVGLKIKPNFESILLKEHQGVPEEDFIDFDADFSFAGKTIEKDVAEASTHEDFETLRAAAASGAEVTFIYGRIATGEKQVTGSAIITDFSEDAGSEKKMGSFSGSLKAKKGTVQFGVQA